MTPRCCQRRLFVEFDIRKRGRISSFWCALKVPVYDASGDLRIMVGHVLRNAMIPIITHVVLAIPFLFTGSLLLESFFGIPGLGSLTVDAINGNDFSTLRTMVFIGALLFVVGQILTDICYALADPRVRLD